MRHLAGESASLEQSHFMVEGLIGSQASFESLQAQRHRLRGIHGVMAGIDDKLGLTQTTMRLIERRDNSDAYLVAAGMVLTCLVIYFVWF